jgi:hypothetical protein
MIEASGVPITSMVVVNDAENANGYQKFRIEFAGNSLLLRRNGLAGILEMYQAGAGIYGGYVSIDPRLDTSIKTPWYTTPKYRVIKDFMTWLGWNEANPTDFTSLLGQPSIDNLLRFFGGLPPI